MLKKIRFNKFVWEEDNMDTKLTRRESRENAFLAAFSITFGEEDLEQTLADCREDAEHPLDAFGEALIRGFYDHSAEIDEMIAAHLKGWSMSRIPRLNMTALRLALSEIFYSDEKKPAVAINEIVTIVKKYGSDNDYQFVNGLLGTVVREHGLADQPE